MIVNRKGQPLIIDIKKGKIRRFTVGDLVKMGRDGFVTSLQVKFVRMKRFKKAKQ